MGVAVEVNSETDFVARNEQFQSIVANIAKLAHDADGDVGKLSEMPYPGTGRSASAELTDAIAKIGENMNLRRTAAIVVTDGVIGSYVHNSVKPGLGRLGVIVGLESTGDKDKLAALGKQISMHIANTNPLSVSPDDIDPEVVARERAIFSEQARESGKPEAVIEKMIEGRVRKVYEEVTLLAQVFVVDGEPEESAFACAHHVIEGDDLTGASGVVELKNSPGVSFTDQGGALVEHHGPRGGKP